MEKFRASVILALVLFSTGSVTLADEPCGYFLSADPETGADLQQPIRDCDEPWFLFRDDRVTDISYTYNSERITDGGVYQLDADTNAIRTEVTLSEALPYDIQQTLFLVEGSNYRLMASLAGSDTITIESIGEYVLLTSVTTPLTTPDPIQVSDATHTPLKRLGNMVREAFIPTAHAQQTPPPSTSVDLLNQTTIRFTIEGPPEPQGASSVLFLPGIQASRLYTDGIFGSEDQVWEPSVNRGQDVRQLAFTDDGTSENDIYTKRGDVIDRTNYAVGSDVIVYDTWLQRLEQEKNDETIADWEALAYDWRYDVRDVVRDGVRVGSAADASVIKPLALLEQLSDASPANKVSIVAHSNGGLLAKALLVEAGRLCRDNPNGLCLLDRVDQLILLGVPQTGTPEGLKQLLHGSDPTWKVQQAIPADDFRAVARTLPGAHSLLPGEKYLDDLTFPTVTFVGNGPMFEQYQAAYPRGISTAAELEQFLVGVEGRDEPKYRDLNRPVILTEELVKKGNRTNHLLADWVVPDDIKVTEIVGVGLPTVSRIRYDSFEERVRGLSGIFGTLELMKPRFGVSLYGDQTVMVRSASGYEGDKETFYVDLSTYNEDAGRVNSGLLPAEHVNISEPRVVQDLVLAIL